MVSPVVTASESATVQEVAKLLIDRRISAVPVVNAAGKLTGIVTESDLMRRAEIGTERQYSWWLSLLADARTLASDYVKSRATNVKDIMTRNVKTAAPDTPLHEIAELFEKNHIKRVPIVNGNGEMVGIVSRANIIQAVACVRPRLEISLPDAAIRSRLIEELKKQPWTQAHKLNVMVAGGVVELWGFVENEQERDAIKIAAEAIPGVTAVNDHLLRAVGFGY
jgi:CBS domain-containing protein